MKPFWKKSSQQEPVRDIVNELSLCCQTLDKKSIGIILESFAEYDEFILSGDTSCNLNLSPEYRYKIKSIEADSSMNEKDLEQFLELLSHRLENNNTVRNIISEKIYAIECFKDNEWQKCVEIVPKGFTLI